MASTRLIHVALFAVVALTGCATAVVGTEQSPTPTPSSAEPVAPLPPAAHITIDDAVAVVPAVPEVSWMPASEVLSDFEDPYGADSAGELVERMSTYEELAEREPCDLYRWSELVVSGSDAESQDPLQLLGVAVNPNTTTWEALDYASVRAREFLTPADANAWLDGFVDHATACPSTDNLGVDYVDGLNTVSVADRQLPSGERIVETVAVGESEAPGDGTYMVAIAVDNVVVVVWLPKHDSDEYALGPTAAKDLAEYYADALH